MKISLLLDNLLSDLEGFCPMSLGQIVIFTKTHKNFVKICMLARNSTNSAKYLLNQCECLDAENEISDIQLAAMIVIIGEIENQGTLNMY